MKKLAIIIALICGLGWPGWSQAQESAAQADTQAEARVIRVLETRQTSSSAGLVLQQDLELLIESGAQRGRKVETKGIGDLVVNNANIYKAGDRVIVGLGQDSSGRPNYYVLDYVRSSALLLLTGLFVAVSLVIGGFKGLKSLLSLLFSFLVIMKLMVPAVLAGWPPLLIGLISAAIILAVIIYVTEGWNRQAHVAVVSIALSLSLTALLSMLFTWLSRLTGLGQEETAYVAEFAGRTINYQGLLLASFVIGTLGAVDDVVISQIEAIQQLRAANPSLKFGQVFRMGMAIGRSHFGAMVNTLFLAYAGASLPLLLLFGLKSGVFADFSQIINHEEIATEIVRTLVGVIGLAMALPLSTWLAARYLKADGKQPVSEAHRPH
jgi:uncharacterized membrane protein